MTRIPINRYCVLNLRALARAHPGSSRMIIMRSAMKTRSLHVPCPADADVGAATHGGEGSMSFWLGLLARPRRLAL